MSKKWVTILLVLLLSICAFGQTTEPTNYYGAGATYNNGADVTPVAGTAFFAHKLTDAALPTYAFTVADFVPYQTTTTAGKKVFNFTNVTSNVGIGVMQKVAMIGRLPLYATTSGGVSWNGTNTGWGFTGGGGTFIKFPKGNCGIAPTMRFAKSSVNNGVGYQLLPGVLFVCGN